MKKVLLFSVLIAGMGASAQTFTVDDTLSNGLSQSFFVMDSTAESFSGTTGTGVTWEYDTLLAYTSATSLDQVTLASVSGFASNFPAAEYNDDLANGASIFFSNSEDSVTVYGYVFEVDGMEVIVMHNSDPLRAMTFPMTVGDTYDDNIIGEVEIAGNTGTTMGDATVTVDGSGTLIVGDNSHANITRVKLVENLATTIDIPFVGTVSGTVTRTLYSYYAFADGPMPIFMHATIDVASSLFNGGYTAAYYAGSPVYVVGTEEMTAPAFAIYPNPAADFLQITTDGNAASLNIFNTQGQLVISIENPQSTEQIDITGLTAGVYLVQVNMNGILSEQKLVIE